MRSSAKRRARKGDAEFLLKGDVRSSVQVKSFARNPERGGVKLPNLPDNSRHRGTNSKRPHTQARALEVATIFPKTTTLMRIPFSGLRENQQDNRRLFVLPRLLELSMVCGPRSQKLALSGP